MTSDDANLARNASQRSGAPRPAVAPDVPSSATLEQLVDRSIDGDQRALTELLRILRPLVVRYCRSRLGEYERVNVSADDVAQEVCLAVLRALPTYQDQGRPFLAFVYGIAQHKVVDGHRSAGRDRSIPFATIPDSTLVSDFAGEPWPSTQLEAELGIDIDEDESTVSALLSNLPDMEREVLRLSVVSGLGPERTAEALDIAPATALEAQRKALDELRAQLEEMQEEEELRAFAKRDWEGAPITGFVGLDALLNSADENLQRLLPEAERGSSILLPWEAEPGERSSSTDQPAPGDPGVPLGSPWLVPRLSTPSTTGGGGRTEAIRRAFNGPMAASSPAATRGGEPDNYAHRTELARRELGDWIGRLAPPYVEVAQRIHLHRAQELQKAIARRDERSARTNWRRLTRAIKGGFAIPPSQPERLSDFDALFGK